MSISYRPEIDGLRALAVLVVIFHHLSLPGFNGGFVGVDVFFVISGYLITSIVLKDISSGSFSLGEFYKRRVIRIAPAYFLVIFMVMLASLFIMLPIERVNLSWSALSSLVFAANFYMWKVVGGYFGGGSETIPLLHLWSLAVEEQFYVIWPLTLLIISRFPRASFGLLVSIALVITVVVSEWAVTKLTPGFTYYMMPIRAFELLLGAGLSLIPIHWIDKTSNNIRHGLSWLGLSLIIYSTVYFDNETPFPGLYALVPCMGAVLLIAFLRPSDNWIDLIFSNKMSVLLGKLSYPAYLWHWPIIVFLHISLITITLEIALLVFIGTFLLSFVTYNFIELPARKLRTYNARTIILYVFLLPSFIFSALLFSIIFLKGDLGYDEPELISRAKAINRSAHNERPGCHTAPPDFPLGEDDCVLGRSDRNVDFLLVGDSHANHFTGMLDVMAVDANIRGYEVTNSSAVFMPDVDRYFNKYDRIVRQDRFFQRNKYIVEALLPNSYKFVVIAGAFNKAYRKDLFVDALSNVAKDGINDPLVFERGFDKSIKLIIESGSIPVIIKGSPSHNEDVSSCTLNNLRFNLNHNCRMKRGEYEAKFHQWSLFLENIEKEHPSVIIIDPAKVMCDVQYCYSELNDVPLYRDKGHLNYEGSMLIGELYIEQFGNPFKVEN
jgi:peptidoglycan/LPS O-acetylase OafA/YrhL